MSMRVTTEMLLKPEHGSEGITQTLLDEVTAIILEELLHETGFVVIPFYDAPDPLRKVFNWNGGDEDWMVIARKEPEWMPNWLERMSSDGLPDIYLLDGFVVYVGSHA